MATYSHSKLSSFENCPRQYYYRYVARVRVPKAESISLFLGSRVHETLEHLYRQRRDGVVVPREELLEHFRQNWNKAWTDEVDLHGKGTPQGWRDIGVKCVEDYYDRHHPFDDTRTIGLEKKLNFALDDSGGYGMTGYIDRLSKRPDGTWEIHDYKTGGSLPTQPKMDADKQLALYQIGLAAMWKDVDAVELVWHYLRHDERITSTRTAEELRQLKTDTISLIDDIESRKGEPAFPTHESPLCNWCDFQGICPIWRHRLAVAETQEPAPAISNGKTLVDRWAELDAKKKELSAEEDRLSEEIDRIKAKLVQYARAQGFEVVAGSEMEVSVSTKESWTLPRKTQEPEQAAELEASLRDSKWWEQVSRLDASRLRKLLDEGTGTDPELRALIQRFASRTQEQTVRLRQKRSSK